MSARDELVEIVTRDPESSGGDEVWATDLVVAHDFEVGRERADLIRADTAADYTHIIAAYGRAYANGWKAGRDRAADLIEKGESA